MISRSDSAGKPDAFTIRTIIRAAGSRVDTAVITVWSTYNRPVCRAHSRPCFDSGENQTSWGVSEPNDGRSFSSNPPFVAIPRSCFGIGYCHRCALCSHSRTWTLRQHSFVRSLLFRLSRYVTFVLTSRELPGDHGASSRATFEGGESADCLSPHLASTVRVRSKAPLSGDVKDRPRSTLRAEEGSLLSTSSSRNPG